MYSFILLHIATSRVAGAPGALSAFAAVFLRAHGPG
jgi:hypothetical protein